MHCVQTRGMWRQFGAGQRQLLRRPPAQLWFAIFAVVAVLPLSVAQAHQPACVAKGLPVTKATVVVYDLDTSFPEISTKLAKGLAVTILHELRREREGATFVFGCKIYFDLWAEAYKVTSLTQDQNDHVVAIGTEQTISGKSAAFALCEKTVSPWTFNGLSGVSVATMVDPISPEQEAKTREWLAEKGIGGNSKALFGRAAATLTNFHQKQSKERDCEVLPL